MKRLRENAMLDVEISNTGEVKVEGHHVGQLRGFRFTSDATGEGADAKAARNAAQKALAVEIGSRAEKLAAGANSDFALESNGIIRWLGEPVAKLATSEEMLKPGLILLADEQLNGTARDKVSNRLERWVNFHIEALLKPVVELFAAKDFSGLVRGVAFRLVENLGVIDRRDIAEDIRALDQEARGLLRRHGVRFGAYHIFIPALLKPSPAALATLLWALKNDHMESNGLTEIPQISAAGRTSVAVDPEFLPEFYRLSGFRILGKKAVRVDILERLADLIRPAIMWREGGEAKRPDGGFEGTGFLVTPAMMSILGATHEDMNEILSTLGYRADVKTEEFIQNRLAIIDPSTVEAKPEQPETPATGDETAEETKPVSEETNETKTDVKADVTTDGPIEEKPEEVKTISIWRPAKQNRGNSNARPFKKQTGNKQAGDQQNNSGKKFDKRANRTANKNFKNSGKPNSHGRKHKPEKAMDPDSPFAKLAALKASLENKK